MLTRVGDLQSQRYLSTFLRALGPTLPIDPLESRFSDTRSVSARLLDTAIDQVCRTRLL
jgi:hypothetical protein